MGENLMGVAGASGGDENLKAVQLRELVMHSHIVDSVCEPCVLDNLCDAPHPLIGMSAIEVKNGDSWRQAGDSFSSGGSTPIPS